MGHLRATLLAVAGCVLLCNLFQVQAFTDSFEGSWADRWSHSTQEKYSGRFVAEAPEGHPGVSLKVPEKAKHYGLATVLEEPVDPAEGLVLQYSLKLANGLTCGGGYLKFLTEGLFAPEELKDDTPYTVMFGPDKCGATNKVHLILRHKSPKTGKIEEKHLKSPPSALLDSDTHVYTAILRPDNTYAVLVDGEEKKAGSILEDFDPAINPPEEIDDSEDKKPEDWVDTAKIPDPEAVKPDDWDEDAPRTIPDEDAEKPEGWLDDEPAKIDDPDAKQPEEWDEEEDGQWEPPQIPNPKCKEAPGCGEWVRPTKPNPAYKGKWSAPLIDNPEYKGVWKPRKIPNPDYYQDEEPLKNIGKVGGVAIEIWTMDDGIYFSDVVVANDPSVAEDYRTQTYEPKKAIEAAAKAKKAEEDKKKAEEEEAKKQNEKAESSATGILKVVNEVSEVVGEKINEAFDAVFGISFLAPYKQALEGPLVALTGTPLILLPAVLITTLLSLTLISRALFGGSKAVAGSKPVSVAEAKKADITPVNDEAEEEEEEEDETDKADDKKGTTRRRAPRRDT